MPDQTGAGTQRAASTGNATDPAIEALQLSATAKAAAYKVKAKFPAVVFTSGRRDKAAQARAMASNVVQNRNWIKETYISSDAILACQQWVDNNPDKTTQSDIAIGLKSVFDGLTDAQLSHVSKHLSGDAFDVQPVTDASADSIKQMLFDLTGAAGGKFLDKEGGLLRWHAQF